MVIHAIKYLQKQKRLIEHGKADWTTVEQLEAAINQLKEQEQEENKTRTYQTYVKQNNKWLFVGWMHQMNEMFCITSDVRGNYIYKTYKWLDGKEEEYRYDINYLEEG